MARIEIREIEEASLWNEFLERNNLGYFLQSWEWGIFLEKVGRRAFRLGIYESDNLIGVCLAYEEVSRFGKFVYAPRGPILSWENIVYRRDVLEALKGWFKGKGFILLRLDPAVLEGNEEVKGDFKAIGFKDATSFVQVERAWMLDLTQSEEELLKGMRKNSRYYLRQAQKVGVVVEESKNMEDFEEFLGMLEILSHKKGFSMVSKDYLRIQFEVLRPLGVIKFFCAKVGGKVMAGAVVAFSKNEASYLHGASSESVGDTQAPYLNMWNAILKAKEMGIPRFNFWGVVEDKNYHPGYPGFGYSNFKKGFGGYVEVYMRTQDYAYNSLKYSLLRMNEWYRKVRFKGN